VDDQCVSRRSQANQTIAADHSERFFNQSTTNCSLSDIFPPRSGEYIRHYVGVFGGGNSMAWAAPAQHQIINPSEATGSQISKEDMEKLQEIHELINILFTELTTRPPQSAATSYVTTGMMPAMPSAPYPPSLFQYAWGSAPYMKLPGF
jgi:hypothetical protein